jgi:hypothetical protein
MPLCPEPLTLPSHVPVCPPAIAQCFCVTEAWHTHMPHVPRSIGGWVQPDLQHATPLQPHTAHPSHVLSCWLPPSWLLRCSSSSSKGINLIGIGFLSLCPNHSFARTSTAGTAKRAGKPATVAAISHSRALSHTTLWGALFPRGTQAPTCRGPPGVLPGLTRTMHRLTEAAWREKTCSGEAHGKPWLQIAAIEDTHSAQCFATCVQKCHQKAMQ